MKSELTEVNSDYFSGEVDDNTKEECAEKSLTQDPIDGLDTDATMPDTVALSHFHMLEDDVEQGAYRAVPAKSPQRVEVLAVQA